MQSCQALIFDFDGVIVDSEDIKTRACETLYREHGSAVVAAVVAHHRANGGISRRKKIRHCHRTLLGIELDEASLERLCRRFSELVEDEVVNSDWVPGAQEALAAHCGRKLLFIVSGTPQEELTRIIERRGLARCFAEVHGSPPDKATTIRLILGRHRLDPCAVVFVGDAVADWRAARKTGVRFIGRIEDRRLSPFPPGTPPIPNLTQLLP